MPLRNTLRSKHASNERKAVLERNLQHLHADIEASPERRFITFCLRLGARSWYDCNFDAAPLWRDVYVNMQFFDYVWGKVFAEIDVTKGLEKFNIPILLILGRFDFLCSSSLGVGTTASKIQKIDTFDFGEK